MRVPAIALALLSFVTVTSAAGPGGNPDVPITTYRIEAAEVHVAFAAYDKKKRPVAEVSAADFQLLRDGRPLDEVPEVERRHESPIAATVMTDVSESMVKAVPMARESWKWMDANLLQQRDKVIYFDFGVEVTGNEARQKSNLTSFYDCLLDLIPQIADRQDGRKVLILFTDGQDNYSLHSLREVTDMALRRDLAVYAITTWRYKIVYNEVVLDQLTKNTGGRFFVVKDQKEMANALKQIVDEQRNGYEVIFRADKARGGMHRIAMESTDGHLRFYHRMAYYQDQRAAEAVLVAGR
jgi:hypothetical protein